MEQATRVPTGVGARVTQWIGRGRNVISLVVAVGFGLLLLQPLIGLLEGVDSYLRIAGGQVALIDLIWLGLALVVALAILVVRAGVTRDIDAAMRRLGTDGSHDEKPEAGTRSQVDVPALSAAIARGVLDFLLLFAIQAMLRPPILAVGYGFAREETIEGIAVVLVVLVALLMLIGLQRSNRPLTEYLVWTGLNQVVPTAGYSARTASETATFGGTTRSGRTGATTSRVGGKTASPATGGRGGTRPAGQATPPVSAPAAAGGDAGSEAPTVLRGAAASDAPAVLRGVAVSDAATVLHGASAPDDPTVMRASSTAGMPVGDSDPTVIRKGSASGGPGAPSSGAAGEPLISNGGDAAETILRRPDPAQQDSR